ncbi:MAG: STAS domain-containing protein [Patescibacteria group bacterium]|nr:STAS domain-containing protein [Patescibacteria group bacterium]
MRIETRVDQDVHVMAIMGRLDALTAPEAEVVLNRAVDEGASWMVVNLAGLEYISSAGLRVLVATGKRLARENGKMVLCELHDGVREVFEISGLLFVLTVATTEDRAVSLVRES